MFKSLYFVRIESDGKDCDGPITYPTQEGCLDHNELIEVLGRAVLRHGRGGIVNPEDSGDWTEFVFSNPNDEGGYFRTCIGVREFSSEEITPPRPRCPTTDGSGRGEEA